MVHGFMSYQKSNGTNGWAADVGLGYDMDGWKASTESNFVRMNQSGGLSYGLANGSALSLDLGSSTMDGAIGGSGNDTISAGSKKGALLEGGAGNDLLTGGTGDDWINGGAGADTLNGGDGDDTLLLDATDTSYNGGKGFDIGVITSAGGMNINLAQHSLEAVIGGEGADTLNTTGGRRVVLVGGAGGDNLTGGRNNDVLTGGTGNDVLAGANGDDTYVFNRGDGADSILDANMNVDYGAWVVRSEERVGSQTVLDKQGKNDYIAAAYWREYKALEDKYNRLAAQNDVIVQGKKAA